MQMTCPKCYQAYDGVVVVCPRCQNKLVWAQPASVEAAYAGFGGWLILFVIVLVIVFPLIAALGLVSSFNVLGRLFAYYPGMLAVFMIDLLFKIVLVIWGFYVVYLLVTLKPFAGETAKTFLIGRAVYTCASILFPFVSTIPATATAVLTAIAIFTAVPSFIFLTIWYIYFQRSKRVEATYGKPESGGAWLA